MLLLALEVNNDDAATLLGGLKALQDAAGLVITTSAAKVSKYAAGSPEMRQAVEEEEYATKLFAVVGRLIATVQAHQIKLAKPVYKRLGEVIKPPRRSA